MTFPLKASFKRGDVALPEAIQRVLVFQPLDNPKNPIGIFMYIREKNTYINIHILELDSTIDFIDW